MAEVSELWELSGGIVLRAGDQVDADPARDALKQWPMFLHRLHHHGSPILQRFPMVFTRNLRTSPRLWRLFPIKSRTFIPPSDPYPTPYVRSHLHLFYGSVNAFVGPECPSAPSLHAEHGLYHDGTIQTTRRLYNFHRHHAPVFSAHTTTTRSHTGGSTLR